MSHWKQIDKKLVIGPVNLNSSTILDYERTQDRPDVFERYANCRLTRTSYFLILLNLIEDITTQTGKTYDTHNAIGYENDINEELDIDDHDSFVKAEQLLEHINS